MTFLILAGPIFGHSLTEALAILVLFCLIGYVIVRFVVKHL